MHVTPTPSYETVRPLLASGIDQGQRDSEDLQKVMEVDAETAVEHLDDGEHQSLRLNTNEAKPRTPDAGGSDRGHGGGRVSVNDGGGY